MAAERQYWFGLSISTPESVENRNNKFVKAIESQSIGDLVARDCDLTQDNDYILDRIEASRRFISNINLTQSVQNDIITCESSMPVGILYNDFGIRYVYARLKKRPASRDEDEVPGPSTDGLQYLMALQRKYDHLPTTRYKKVHTNLILSTGVTIKTVSPCHNHMTQPTLCAKRKRKYSQETRT